MKENKVSLYINGKVFSWWIAVSVKVELRSFSRSFLVSTTRDLKDSTGVTKIPPGSAVVLKIDNDVVVSGYITKVTRSYTNKAVTIKIEGKSKTQDLIDCSLSPDDAKTFNNQKVTSILSTLAALYGIRFIDEVGIEDKITLNADATKTIKEIIEGVIHKESYLITDSEKGDLVLCNVGSAGNATDSLRLGFNVLNATRVQDHSRRFSEYHFLGQKTNPFSEGTINPNLEAVAKDPGVRKRVFTTLSGGDADYNELKKAAELRRDQGEHATDVLTFSVHGWRQSDDSLWKVNSIVNVKDKFLDSNEDYLITKLTFNLDQNGTNTELTCENPLGFIQLAKKTAAAATKAAVQKESGIVNKGDTESASWTKK